MSSNRRHKREGQEPFYFPQLAAQAPQFTPPEGGAYVQVLREVETLVNFVHPTEAVVVEDVHDQDEVLRVRRGCTVQRETAEGLQRGVVGKVTNWRWANVWWVRADGTVHVESTRLVGLKWAGVSLSRLRHEGSGNSSL